MTDDGVPDSVIRAFDLEPTSVRLIPSLINRTLSAQTRSGQRLIVQRLHPIFGASLHDDIACIDLVADIDGTAHDCAGHAEA